MKRKNIFCIAAIALVAAMMASCEKGPYTQQDKNEAGSYIQISVAFAGSEATKTAEDSGQTVEGTVAENKIVTAYLYFFKDGNYSTTVKIGGGEFTPGTASASDGNVYYTSKPTEIPSGTYNVYATLNNEIADLTGTTEENFKKKQLSIKSFPITVNESTGIAMSSRSTDGTLYQTVTVTSANTFDNPVHIYLDIERSFAKLRYKAGSNYSNVANTFTVHESRKTSGTAICNITLTNYNVINITQPYYLFRQVADLENNGGSITATNNAYSALTTTNYIYDPVTTSRTFSSETLADVTSSVTKTLYTTTKALPTGTTDFTHLEYLTENSMHQDVQKQGYATALVFTGDITPATGNYYTTDSGNAVNTTDYSTGDLWFYNNRFYDSMGTLNIDTNLEVDNSNYAAFGVKYYKDGLCYYRYYIKHLDNGINPGAVDQANDRAEMGVMEYAIVRNNSYDVTVSNILAPGQSRLADDDYGYPNTDDAKKDIEMDEVYFQVKLTIKPWIARTQSAVLG